MPKIIVSSKTLGDALKSSLFDTLSVDILSVNSRGEGTLTVMNGDNVVARISAVCSGSFHFHFAFRDEIEVSKFRNAITDMLEQPITLEDGAFLSVKSVSVFY